MYGLLNGLNPIPLFVAVGLATLISGAIGWWLKNLIQPKRISQSASDIGRKWGAWIVFAVCVTNLTPFIVRLDKNSFALWVLGVVIFGAAAYMLGWVYGKLVLFKNATSASGQNPDAFDLIQGDITKSDDDEFFAQVAREMATDKLDDGLWAKAYALQNGDEPKAKAYYIRNRVAQLKNSQKQVQSAKILTNIENGRNYSNMKNSELLIALNKYKWWIVVALVFVVNHIVGLILGWW